MKDDHSTNDPHADGRSINERGTGDHGSQAPQRPWRQLAEAVLRETDHVKILQLAQELCDAVDEQVLGHRKKSSDG